jgi:tetratricopeptide (TPR) repeat protein
MLESLSLAAPSSAVVHGALYRLLVDRLGALVETAIDGPDTQLAAAVNAALTPWTDSDPGGELVAAASRTLRPLLIPADDDLAKLGRNVAALAVGWYEREPRRTKEERRAHADALSDLVAYHAAFDEAAAAEAAAGRAYQTYRELGSGLPPDVLARSAYNYGTCLARSGDLDQACRLLDEAKRHFERLPPGDSRPAVGYADALINLAVCHADLGHRRQSAEVFVQAVDCDSAVLGPEQGLDYGLPELAGPIRNLARKSPEDPVDSGPVPGGPGTYRPPTGTAGAGDYHFMGTGGRAVLNRLAARLAEDAAEWVPKKLRNAVLPFLIGPLARQQARFEAEDNATFLFLTAGHLANQGQYDAARAPAIASVALLRQFVQDDPSLRSEIADRLGRLGVWNFRSGRSDDAVASARESADEYRILIREDQRAAGRISDVGLLWCLGLAMALSDLADYLTDAHRLPEAVAAAREAVAAYRDVANHDPRYRASFADESLRLGALLAGLNQQGDAVEPLQQAVLLFDELAAADDKYAEPLTAALSLLSACSVLTEPQHLDQTLAQYERAVELNRRRAEADPGRKGDLADSLVALSGALGALGRTADARAEAERAVAIDRELVAAGDDRTTALAGALAFVSRYAVHFGNPGEAVVRAQEAVGLLTDIPDYDPEIRFTRASALSALAQALLAAEQPADALDPVTRAIGAFDALAESDEEYPGLDFMLAEAMVTLGTCLTQLGRPDEALPAVAAATEVLRGAAMDAPSVRAISAQALQIAGACLSLLGRESEALDPLGQAEQLLRDLSEEDPVSALRLAATRTAMGECHLSLGDADGAIGYLEQAIAVLRTAAAGQPGHRIELARALAVRATTLLQLGRAADALPSGQEALELCREPAPGTSQQRIVLGTALNAVGGCLYQLGRPEEAAASFDEAATVFRQLEPGQPAGFITGPFALALNGLADCRTALGDLAGMIAAAAEGRELLQAARVPEADPPSPLLPLYGSFLARQAGGHFQLGLPAVEPAAAAVTVFRRLSASDDSMRLALAEMLGLEAVARRTTGASGADVLTPAIEAAGLYQEFVAEGPSVIMPLASTLALAGGCLVELEELPEALNYLGQSSGYYRQLPETSAQLLAEHIDVERTLAFCHGELGDADSAAACLNVAVELLQSAVDGNPELLPLLEDTRNWLASILE